MTQVALGVSLTCGISLGKISAKAYWANLSHALIVLYKARKLQALMLSAIIQTWRPRRGSDSREGTASRLPTRTILQA
jgi:hypothetical protein